MSMSIDFRSVSNTQLKSQLENLSRSERKITAQVIEHIAEVERRRLHLAWGYANLFDYLTKSLHYSEGAAYRRIQAARALKQMPLILEGLEKGSLKLSQIAQVETAMKQEERATGQKVSLERKREVFAKIENKNGYETKKIIAKDFTKGLGDGYENFVEMNLKLPERVSEDLKRIKELYSHIDPHASWEKVIELMAKDLLKLRDPLAQKARAEKKLTQSFAATEVKSNADQNRIGKGNSLQVKASKQIAKTSNRHVPANIKRLVFQRDQGKCQYKSETGHICGSKFQSQIDHVRPIYLGGTNEAENLRVLCANHNRFYYEFGCP
jgi:hypothetical protein